MHPWASSILWLLCCVCSGHTPYPPVEFEIAYAGENLRVPIQAGSKSTCKTQTYLVVVDFELEHNTSLTLQGQQGIQSIQFDVLYCITPGSYSISVASHNQSQSWGTTLTTLAIHAFRITGLEAESSDSELQLATSITVNHNLTSEDLFNCEFKINRATVIPTLLYGDVIEHVDGWVLRTWGANWNADNTEFPPLQFDNSTHLDCEGASISLTFHNSTQFPYGNQNVIVKPKILYNHWSGLTWDGFWWLTTRYQTEFPNYQQWLQQSWQCATNTNPDIVLATADTIKVHGIWSALHNPATNCTLDTLNLTFTSQSGPHELLLTRDVYLPPLTNFPLRLTCQNGFTGILPNYVAGFMYQYSPTPLTGAMVFLLNYNPAFSQKIQTTSLINARAQGGPTSTTGSTSSSHADDRFWVHQATTTVDVYPSAVLDVSYATVFDAKNPIGVNPALCSKAGYIDFDHSSGDVPNPIDRYELQLVDTPIGRSDSFYIVCLDLFLYHPSCELNSLFLRLIDTKSPSGKVIPYSNRCKECTDCFPQVPTWLPHLRIKVFHDGEYWSCIRVNKTTTKHWIYMATLTLGFGNSANTTVQFNSTVNGQISFPAASPGWSNVTKRAHCGSAAAGCNVSMGGKIGLGIDNDGISNNNNNGTALPIMNSGTMYYNSPLYLVSQFHGYIKDVDYHQNSNISVKIDHQKFVYNKKDFPSVIHFVNSSLIPFEDSTVITTHTTIYGFVDGFPYNHLPANFNCTKLTQSTVRCNTAELVNKIVDNILPKIVNPQSVLDSTDYVQVQVNFDRFVAHYDSSIRSVEVPSLQSETSNGMPVMQLNLLVSHVKEEPEIFRHWYYFASGAVVLCGIILAICILSRVKTNREQSRALLRDTTMIDIYN